MFDILTTLSVTDTDEEPSDHAELYRLYSVLLWILVPLVLAGGVSIVKDVSAHWRVMNTPSISTTAEKNEVHLLQELEDRTAAIRRFTSQPLWSAGQASAGKK